MSRRFTVTAAPSGAFVASADGLTVIDTAAEPPVAGMGATAAAAAAMDRPLALPGGEQVEEMGGPDSVFARRWGYLTAKFVISAGPTHAAMTTSNIASVGLLHIPTDPSLVLARAAGAALTVRITLENVSAGTRVVRYLVGAPEATARIGEAGFMGSTLATGETVTLTVPSGQRISFRYVTGGGQSRIRAEFLDAGEAIFGAPNPIPPTRARIFDPAGRHAALDAGGFARVPFKVRRQGAGADETLTAVVRRAIPATQPAVSAVALDADGDPVAFRFDRLHPIGQALDGRPFVVAPNGVRLMGNDGSRVLVPANRVARWKGAELLVVKAAGQIPSRVVTVSITDEYRLAAGVAAPTFSTDWTTAVNQGAGLTVQDQFESLHLYLQSADAAATEVRFRKVGEATWYAAQPLTHDARDPASYGFSYLDETGASRPATMAEATPGNHRGVIAHLRPGTAYEVEVRQGARLWRAQRTTRQYKRAKLSIALGTVNGDVAITKSGDVVTVTRAGLPNLTITAAGTTFAEIRAGLVRGGCVTIDAPRIILRDIDVIDAPQRAITLTPRAQAVRIVRGRIATWGLPDNDRVTTAPAPAFDGYNARNVGWANRYTPAIYWPPGSAASRDVSVIGVRFGAPRYPSNHWEQFNPSTGYDGVPDVGKHPWGSSYAFHRAGSFLGGNAFMDCSFAGSSLRPCEDGIMSAPVLTGLVAGFGPNAVFAHCYVAGVTDDAFELDGTNQNLLALGNWFDMERGVQWVAGPVACVSASVGFWGPTILRRNVFRYRLRRPDLKTFGMGGESVKEQSNCIKIKRSFREEKGVVVIEHNTALPSEAMPGREGVREFMAAFGNGVAPAVSPTEEKVWMGHIAGRANLARIGLTSTIATPTGVDVVWSDNDIARDTAAVLTFEPDSAIPATGAVAAAPRLANVNDGGPWGAAAARVGAMS